ncbi:MAG: glycosyltransferase [Pirellulales bacterium]
MESRLPGGRIKVCHVIPTLDQGGAEKQLCLLAGGMDSERFETHVVVLTHSGLREAELRARGIPVHAINKRGKFDFSALSRLTKLLRDLQPQIVHTWLFAANCYGRYAAVKARVPVIIAGERCVDPWKSWWHGALDRYFLKHTRTIVTNTTAVVDFYARRGIGADRFTVIANGVELPKQNRLSRAEVFARLKIDPTESW